MAKADLTSLPNNLPIPIDDLAAAHLPGVAVPSIALESTDGSRIDLSTLSGRTVLYYPLTGQPGVALPEGWDQIPGARGCTPEACGFRDHHAELRALDVAVYGLSTQKTDYQQEAAVRLHLPFSLLSDALYSFTDALGLPTFRVEGQRLLRRLTLVLRDGVVEHVFYPVFPPDTHAHAVVEWLATRKH